MKSAIVDGRYTEKSPDDSALNAAAAKKYGWNTAHLVEPTAKSPPEPVAQHQISNLEELRKVFPEVFKST
jgi:pyrimidine and pyridine-specific 5'-nucleotidase